MANEGLWQQVVKLNGDETARRAKCQYLPEPNRYTIVLLNREYIVNVSEKQIVGAKSQSQAGFAEELCILAYLINSKDMPLADKLTPPQSLRDGQFFFRGPHSLPTGKLEKVFGDSPELLYNAIEGLGTKRHDFGDAAITLYVLPRIPITIVIWRGDEEFDARASVLFDQTAADQLPLDALWMTVNTTMKALVGAVT